MKQLVEKESKFREDYESYLWTTFCDKPSEEVKEKRIDIMRKLRDDGVVYKALETVQNFLKKEGLENASINVQIFSEFCEKGHRIDDAWVTGEKGAWYFVNTDLNTTKGKDWYNLSTRIAN
jgi:hypothetical protein